MQHIRNFCIIAHIDHGKSTLADRLLERTLQIAERERREQMLDSMDIERERGITIKSQAVTLPYVTKDGQEMHLNLIDTPGHVDFSYEVSRALAACEGALLLIDASQGVEAQTLANMYLALEHDLEIIPVINKIDLPQADIEAVQEEIDRELGLDPDEALLCSAKTGQGVDEVLEAIAHRIPPPQGDETAPLQALIFDAAYNPYRGVLVFVRVYNGRLAKGDEIRFHHGGAVHEVEEVGFMQLKLQPEKQLVAGEVGYIISGVKSVSEIAIGDTITTKKNPCPEPLPGFKEVQPVVFSSIYPVSTDDYRDLADAMERLKLNDASLTYQKDTSIILGQGFRCGFLGLLHLEIVQERLEREFDQSVILTAPSVQYLVTLRTGEEIIVDNPVYFPDPMQVEIVKEPFVRAHFILPDEYLGVVISLCIGRRGIQKKMDYLDKKRVELTFELPLAEIVYDFYDKLKSVSRGYASFDYEFIEHRETRVVKLEILVNKESVDALSVLIHEERAVERARQICKRLTDEIPRQQFKIPIQGRIGGQIISRETIGALRKDVTAKCYGGDVSRKRKLLEKQKKGKKRMMQVGNVIIPQRAFLSVLKAGDD
ncbi:MAG: translation elongation factor 4 [Candidatus Lernaella stagnicola]|nr:translation elongation factor 4 [Candidatus Lernaella stagnicola]